MKTTVFFRMMVLVAMVIAGVANADMRAQENGNYVTNEEKVGELVASKIIYRLDGALYRHMKYDFTYDDQKRMVAKEAYKWNGTHAEWVPYFKISYQYSGNEITMEYGRWNASHKAYDASVEKSVYELNGENMPVAYLNYKWNDTRKDWSMDTAHNYDNNYRLLTSVE